MMTLEVTDSRIDHLFGNYSSFWIRRNLGKDRALHHTKEDLLNQVAAGESTAQRMLVERFTPIVQSRVARKLMGSKRYRDLRQDVLEHTQDILLYLFSHNAKVLLRWQEDRGMSLDNYVGLIAERRTISALRSGRKSAWRESEQLEDIEEPALEHADTETQSIHQNTLEVLLQRMKSKLSPLGWHLFDLLYIQELTVQETVEKTELTVDAIYAWRSRLRKIAQDIRQSLDESNRKNHVSTTMEERS